VLEQAGLRGFGVFAGGAMVVDLESRHPVLQQFLQPELAAEIWDELRGLGHSVMALHNRDLEGVDYLVSDPETLPGPAHAWMKHTGSTFRAARGVVGPGRSGTLRISILGTTVSVESAREALESRFGGQFQSYVIHVAMHGMEVLEIFAPGVDKWSGIRHVAHRLGVNPAEVVAVGDDVNDLPMVRSAGLGVAMGNANPALKQAATRVIGHNADDGLACFLEEFLLAEAA
jgi:hydroxymethylpyrimidine pyrophosphatase-like HAD family hydrolase